MDFSKSILPIDSPNVVMYKDISVYFKNNFIMARNGKVGDGHRNGAVRSRTQTYNPKTATWVKRDSGTGRFMDVKSDGTPFKGVTKK
jgi:hypothetical protein